MSPVYFFEFEETFSTVRSKKAVFFVGASMVTKSSLLEAIDAYFSGRASVDEVLVICPKTRLAGMREVLLDFQIQSRFKISSPRSGNKIRLMTYSSGGVFLEFFGYGFSDEKLCAKDELNRLRQAGLLFIFRKNGGMLEATESYHYVKPSLKHTDKFIRTGNVLINSSEVEFIAVWIIESLGLKTKYIYVDSSSILSVAYALLRIRSVLDEPIVDLVIYSYESYKGLGSESLFGFSEALVIVSASTGGGMLRELVEKYSVNSISLVTLFYLEMQGEKKGRIPGIILCDLTRRTGFHGYDPAIVTASGVREPFSKTSFEIPILSEGFLPRFLEAPPRKLVRSDLPKWWGAFSRSFLGRKAIKCHAILGANSLISLPASLPIGISLGPVLRRDTDFRRKLNVVLLTAVSKFVNKIIYFNDNESKLLVRMLKRLLGTGARKIEWVKADSFVKSMYSSAPVKKRGSDATLVVVGMLTDGVSLLDLAQQLRDFQRNHAISFLIGLAACESEKAFSELKSNLCYSQVGVDYGFYVAERICLPYVRRGEVTCWQEEVGFWRSCFSSSCCISREKLAAEIGLRIKVIESARDVGLVDDVFLCSAAGGERLCLRDNSIFTEQMVGRRASQADVYFAVASLLDSVRRSEGVYRGIFRTGGRRLLLDPTFFFRFSDGVIQAAILRAAEFSELDYRTDAALSSQLLAILCKIFDSIVSPRAEALHEVLYALAIGKLRLLPRDESEFLRLIKGQMSVAPKRWAFGLNLVLLVEHRRSV